MKKGGSSYESKCDGHILLNGCTNKFISLICDWHLVGIDMWITINYTKLTEKRLARAGKNNNNFEHSLEPWVAFFTNSFILLSLTIMFGLNIQMIMQLN